ncbi:MULTISPECIES: alkaline shock response membrane anchor protein AmaP [unclassified Streptomyces]|uniref:alkaline shock response membrane anchor protein AmaP n=1 Tax=unclassified Streptomyces TaxID=2593676 RepID=UPI001BE7B9EB|nr:MULTISPECIES: alkaline shock response membrane anchor protein AmaP [unclassified Streptomyces]MBT2404919.1 alkaline shock response membrane anchor protein AmaP [Streptomyces sp. ISL-21]MBT2455963.1 alkaline shock response membrane anchor protein AmaP [Streptomyces sp. ISL-86]MBT2611352.1 alkaline shock response membrane anchor protein AmaP [Streptomyces sp. ISL-87]
MKRKSAVNRVLLAVTGIVLFGTGLLILAGGFDLYRRWNLTPPEGWPLSTPNAVLLGAADRTRWTDESWWWPVVIAALVIVVLLALWWLLAQLRRTHPGHIPVGGTPAADGVELREQALSDALAADVRDQPGVQQARVRMTGPVGHPEARIGLTLTPGSEPGPVLQELCDGPLPRARQSTGRPRLSAQARLRVTRHKPHRAQ